MDFEHFKYMLEFNLISKDTVEIRYKEIEFYFFLQKYLAREPKILRYFRLNINRLILF